MSMQVYQTNAYLDKRDLVLIAEGLYKLLVSSFVTVLSEDT